MFLWQVQLESLCDVLMQGFKDIYTSIAQKFVDSDSQLPAFMKAVAAIGNCVVVASCDTITPDGVVLRQSTTDIEHLCVGPAPFSLISCDVLALVSISLLDVSACALMSENLFHDRRLACPHGVVGI